MPIPVGQSIQGIFLEIVCGKLFRHFNLTVPIVLNNSKLDTRKEIFSHAKIKKQKDPNPTTTLQVHSSFLAIDLPKLGLLWEGVRHANCLFLSKFPFEESTATNIIKF